MKISKWVLRSSEMHVNVGMDFVPLFLVGLVNELGYIENILQTMNIEASTSLLCIGAGVSQLFILCDLRGTNAHLCPIILFLCGAVGTILKCADDCDVTLK